MQQKTILFAILNWGLGHASRSTPIIQFLQEQNYRVVVCTDGHVVPFLENEIANLTFEYLPAYNIQYSYNSMAVNMLLQSPKIFKTYIQEKRVFQRLVKQYNPIACFSDNRYGCISTSCPTYFIGHQWNILGTNKSPHPIASRVNKYFIRKFDKLLVPDDPAVRITAKMTEHLDQDKAIWLGILSRFSKIDIKEDPSSTKKVFEFLTILSGPEPSRTKLEKKLIDYCHHFPDLQFAIVRGTESDRKQVFPNNCTVYNIVNKKKLLSLISMSYVIIGRSGYSSVMDYLALGINNIIFIPTPGQTEQEYLAEELQKNVGFPYLLEKECSVKNLGEKIKELKNSNKSLSYDIDTNRYKKLIKSLLAKDK